jgi:hypothetical protein
MPVNEKDLFSAMRNLFDVKFSNVELTQNRSIGFFVGTGFWRETGE